MTCVAAFGRARTVVLAGLAAGLLVIAGCEAAAPIERVRMRQEIDFVTVNINDGRSSRSQVLLQREGIGYGACCDQPWTGDKLRSVRGL